MNKKRHSLVVVGGGAAGIIAAWKAASLGASVILLERNTKLGIKLLISGGGKCNITHAGPMEEVRKCFLPNEARFLKPSFYKFSNDDIVRMIESRGVKTYVRQNGRVFPESGVAGDVVGALTDFLEESGVEIRLDARITSVDVDNGVVTGIGIDGKNIPATIVIVATGGMSYQKTGTTGDGVRWARKIGHTIVPLRPALAPIAISPKLPLDWKGIALREGVLSVFSGEKRIASWNDDILITHEGLSGPAVLEVSRAAAQAREEGDDVQLRFDFFPKKDYPALDEELNRLILSHRGKMIQTAVEHFLPNRMVPILLKEIGIDPAKRGHVLTRDERRLIVRLMKEWRIGRVASIELDRGEVSAGGVALEEVDPHTMRSRKVQGLFFCGEVLDIAGPIGGYNLQAAFSTGYVAGEHAAVDWLAKSR